MNSMARACSMVVNLLFPRAAPGATNRMKCYAKLAGHCFPSRPHSRLTVWRCNAGSHADGTVARSEGRFSRGRITATRNVTVRSPMRYAPLQKRLALLTSFVIGMVHAMMLLWFPRFVSRFNTSSRT